MRLHFLMSISVVLTHPGWRKAKYKKTLLRSILGILRLPKESSGKTKRDSVWTKEEVAATISHAQTEAYHRPMDIPEGSFLAVKDLPLSFILFPVNPAHEVISQCENYSMQTFV